ncbi:uncharacterized protein LOC119730014 [Patiria miniata]|uniref:IgGFc-binding protein N-terminal domain-containing protein n=1 Tax=Patiria miniata TaxID=46514 RepID=A0A914A4I1_PATMI|nr:uncharacterized protein LOC119730014 [Patiria miniata]
MTRFSWFASFTASIIIALIPVVNGQLNITEPGRRTRIYGQDFVVVIPLTTGLPEFGSSLQIACVACQSSSATGRITLLQGNFSKSFSVEATSPNFVSLSISELQLLATTTPPTPAMFNITADENITVTVLVKIAGTLNAYTAFPVDSLDGYYIVASYGRLEEDVSELTVVATEPETYFNLHPYSNVTILGHEDWPATMQFRRGIGGWVTYQTTDSFMGGHIQEVTNKPLIGIVGTHRASAEYGWAQSLDQLNPVVSLGTRYTAVPVAGNHLRNIFRIVPVWENTNITWISGQQSSGKYRHESYILNSGQNHDMSCGPYEIGQIQGSKPFLLLHHIEFETPVVDTALVTVPPAEQFTRQSFTFSTYELDTKVDTYITIVAPCKHSEQIWLQETAGRGRASASKVEKKRSVVGGEYCGSNRKLNAGVYTIGPDPASPSEAVYSAILYGKTASGVFAYILASELNQVTCSVKDTEVTLCHPPRVPIQPALTTVQTSTAPNKNNSNVFGAVVAVVIIVAGLAILGFCLFRYYRSGRWKRSGITMRDKPIVYSLL